MDASHVQSQNIGDWQWTLPASARFLLEHITHIPWESLDDREDCKCIKGNAFREVWSVPLWDRNVFAKLYHAPGGWLRVKYAVLGPPGRREFHAAVYGLKHSLDVIRPVAYGRKVRGSCAGMHVFISEAIENSVTLSAFWLDQIEGARSQDIALKTQVLIAVSGLLVDLHNKSFLPADVHPENILIRRVDHRIEASLVDLHHARFGGRISQLGRVRNLVHLNQWFQRHASRSDRLRFLLAYLSQSFNEVRRDVLGRFASDIVEATGWEARRLVKRRDKRILRDNPYFGILELDSGRRAYVYLKSKHPIQGSAASKKHFTKSQWNESLRILDTDITTEHIRVGSCALPVSVEQEERLGGKLKRQWIESYRMIHRHVSMPLPLALVEETVDNHEVTILITERVE